MQRLPEWIRTAIRNSGEPSSTGQGTSGTKRLLRGHRLSTVCEEARCPNRRECFSRPTATFLILGDVCTRDCGFCAVRSGVPALPDPAEPAAVAEAAAAMGLRHVVITSVTRDDLADGGSGHFAAVIEAVKGRLPAVSVEVLTPDFGGDPAALRAVLAAGPDVFNHNVETVPRLYPDVRPQAVYGRSLEVLRTAKHISPATMTKSGLMVGLGEEAEEVHQVLADLRESGCEAVTIGQYLRPSKKNRPVVEYMNPEGFEALRRKALDLGFRAVAAGPLVRSSMNAEELYKNR